MEKYNNKNSLNNILFAMFFLFYLVLPEYFALEISERFPLITASRLILVLYILVCLVKKKFKFPVALCKERNLNNVVVSFIVGMFIVNLLNFPNTPSTTIKELLTVFWEQYLLCWLIVNEVNTREKFKRALAMLVISSGVVAVISIIGTLIGQNLFYYLNTVSRTMLQASFVRSGFLRAEAGFGHAVYYGMYCVVIIPMAAYLYENSQKNKRLYLMCLLLNIVAIFLSNSRGSLLVAVPLCLVIFLKGKHGLSKKYAGVLLGIGILSILVCLISSSARELLLSIAKSLIAIFDNSIQLENFGENAEGMSSRLAQFTAVIDVMENHPILGYGADVITRQVAKVYWVNGWIPLTTLDMGFIGTLVQFGIVGFILEIRLFFCIARKTLINMKNDAVYNMFYLSIIGYLLCLLTVSCLRDTLWVLIGLLIAYTNIKINEKYHA